MRALITSGTDAAAFRLARYLNNREIVFASNEEISNITDKRFVKIPSVNSATFTHELLKVCLDLGIAEVFPLQKDEIIELSQSKLLFGEYNIKIICPSIKFINLRLLNLQNSLSKLIVIKNKEFIAGDFPPDNTLPLEDDGIFKWDIIDHKIEFSLLTI